MNEKRTGRSLRVTIAISEAKMPQWFAFLNAIQSGSVRAEMVRLHLQNPDPSILLKAIGVADLSRNNVQISKGQNEAPEQGVKEVHEPARTPQHQATEQGTGLARSLLRRGGEVSW